MALWNEEKSRSFPWKSIRNVCDQSRQVPNSSDSAKSPTCQHTNNKYQNTRATVYSQQKRTKHDACCFHLNRTRVLSSCRIENKVFVASLLVGFRPIHHPHGSLTSSPQQLLPFRFRGHVQSAAPYLVRVFYRMFRQSPSTPSQKMHRCDKRNARWHIFIFIFIHISIFICFSL